MFPNFNNYLIYFPLRLWLHSLLHSEHEQLSPHTKNRHTRRTTITPTTMATTATTASCQPPIITTKRYDKLPKLLAKLQPYYI